VTRLRTAPALDAALTLDAFDPRPCWRPGPGRPATAEPKALTRAALATRVQAAADALALADLRLTVDDTDLTGQASVRNFQRPILRFALAATALDADRYMPAASATAKAPQGAGQGGAGGQGPGAARPRPATEAPACPRSNCAPWTWTEPWT
jgi:AsmA protein